MATSTDKGSPASSIVILRKPADWDEWLFLLKKQAERTQVWQYVNPALATQPNVPTEPIQPDYPQDDEDDAQVRRYELRYQRYRTDQKAYEKYLRGIKEVEHQILTTINRTCLPYILECTTPYETLKALKARLAPTDRAREIELSAQWAQLRKTPRAQDIDKWLDNWESIYAKAITMKLPETNGDRPLHDFLNAIEGLDPGFAATNRDRILDNPTELPTLQRLIQKFRDSCRIKSAEKELDTHSAFTTFKGLQDQQQRPYCVCGNRHYFEECYYLNQSIRPSDWNPRSSVQRSIQEKIASNPVLASQIQDAKQKAIANHKQSTQDNHSDDKEIVGAFPVMSYSTNHNQSSLDNHSDKSIIGVF